MVTSNKSPFTYQRGRKPIDRIFITPQLLPMAAGGYCGFGDAIPSDHRAIWLDLHLPEICPKNQSAHTKPSARRLKCNDPRVVDKYNTTLWTELQKQQIPDTVQEMGKQLQKPTDVRRKHRNELNAINRQVCEAKHTAENQCRKMKCGAIQWCPQVTKAINKILFWKSVLKRESGGKVGLSILVTRAKKAGIDQVPFLGECALDQIQQNISKAYKQFQYLKRDNHRRDTWLSQVIAAQATAWNQTKKALWNQLRRTEKIKKRQTMSDGP